MMIFMKETEECTLTRTLMELKLKKKKQKAELSSLFQKCISLKEKAKAADEKRKQLKLDFYKTLKEMQSLYDPTTPG